MRIARELGRPLVGHGRRPLPAPRGLLAATPRCCACRPSRRSPSRSSASTPTSSISRAPRRWRSRSRPGRRRFRPRSRSPSAARSRWSSARCCCRAIRRPTARTPSSYLRRLTEEGLRGRYGDPPPAEAVERLETELSVIGEMGFESYFLIVWDFVKYAKDNGIAVGPGRGSAAGSIVSYCLNITDVDPLAYDLMFERFLNAERRSMPDIDIDFSVKGRERVIRYVQQKYGADAVAQIITFGKMAPRAATRDAARVLGHDYATGDRIAKLIPEPIMGRNPSFEECLGAGHRAAHALRLRHRRRKQIVDVARGLEGIVRNNSIHAAAVVIADRPLTEIVPLQLAEDRGRPARRTNGNGNGKPERSYKTVTQYSMGPIEEIGLLKMDFLGLAKPRRARERGRHHRALGRRAHRPRVAAARRRARPTRCSRAATRSASSSSSPRACARRSRRCSRRSSRTSSRSSRSTARARCGSSPTTPAASTTRSRCATSTSACARSPSPTYGIALYQEQLMQIARDIAGFPGPKADTLRSAIGKKKRDLMATLKEDFVAGCKASGTSSTVANQLWSLMESAADYSFNEVHAACYALIAYRTAYLKANYPAEYMAAVISSVMSTKDKVPFFVSRCEEMGIRVLPPDVNESGHDFVVVGRRDQVRARRRQERRLLGGREDPRGARGGRAVHVDLGLLRARRLAHREQEGDREPDQVRRARLDRRDAQGHARRARPGAGRGAEGAGGRAERARRRSSISTTPSDQRPAARDARAGARGRVRARRAAAAGEGDAGDLPVEPSARRRARGAASARRLLARRARRRSRTAPGSRSAGSSPRQSGSAPSPASR